MNVLVIGGGMSGITFALAAKRQGHSVTLVEKNERLGKKLSATGNGKCNVGNANVGTACFNRSMVAGKVLNCVSVQNYTDFLQSVGIFTYADEVGRMYPLSDSANNVVDCFRAALAREGVKVILGKAVGKVQKVNGGYQTDFGVFNKVCLCVGSGSQAEKPVLDGFVESNWLTPVSPSLVPIKVKNSDKTLNGLRAKCGVKLVSNGKTLYSETGEVQFKEYGLSGICIFNASAVIARSVVCGNSQPYAITLDLVPKMDEQTLARIVQNRIDDGWETSTLLCGILHNKIAASVLKNAKNSAQIAKNAKIMTFEVDSLLDWSMSQVTAGGIDERFVGEDLSLPNGIIALGEVLNVDGFCGGNNLYFAAASALYASKFL